MAIPPQGDTPTLRRDAAENRERLISAAVDVFNTEGIDAGVDQIAQRAGVGVGTLYRRFPTKDALIEFLSQRTLENLAAAATAALQAPDGSGLETFLHAAAEEFCRHRGYLRCIWDPSVVDDDAVASVRSLVDRLTRDARKHGVIRTDVKRTDITSLIWALQGIIENAGDNPASACSRFLRVAFAGLGVSGR